MGETGFFERECEVERMEPRLTLVLAQRSSLGRLRGELAYSAART